MKVNRDQKSRNRRFLYTESKFRMSKFYFTFLNAKLLILIIFKYINFQKRKRANKESRVGVRVEKFSIFMACFFTLDYYFSDDPTNNRILLLPTSVWELKY